MIDLHGNPEHLTILEKGAMAWNQWRSQKEAHVDLSKADLSRLRLNRANLSGVDLAKARLVETRFSEADLSGADIGGADLTGAHLREADLRGTNLSKADLSRADFSRADLSQADLNGTNFSRANLRETNLSDAGIANTMFVDVDLSLTNGLDSVFHQGPSSIGIDTVFRSKGQIPDSFLRGCGVPDAFITYAKSLIVSAVEFYSCFISYSTKDQDFADRLYADLQAKGVRCWFAPHDVQGGRKLQEQIDEAIRLHDKLLLILSPHSMESEWVKTEISKARKREVRDQARVLFPISLAPFEAIRDWEAFDADTGKGSAREIRECFIPDFSQWKDLDSYRTTFDRLMRNLQAQPQAPAHTQR
jgi:hypothetical protein